MRRSDSSRCKTNRVPRSPASRGISRRECLTAFLPIALSPLRTSLAAPARPNVLFIMIDTLRADHVGCYGYGKPTTPNLDRLAREGVCFANFHAASPWTMPSLMTMFTSLHPCVHGATSVERRASLKVVTIAERLKALGYSRTVGIVSNPVANARYGFAQGFDLYDDYTISFTHELNLFEADGAGRPKGIHECVTSHTVTRMANEWLAKEGRNGPWFLFLLYFDPHNSYVPPPPWHRKFDPHPDDESRKHPIDPYRLPPKEKAGEYREHVMALYDGEVGYTDHWLGQLLANLDKLGLRDNTLVLVVSDHGEEFLYHGGALHGRTLYNELTRGVLMLRLPGKLPAGRAVNAPVCHLDIPPTILECIGEKPDSECQGAGCLRLIVDTAPTRPGSKDRPCFLEGCTKQALRAVVLDRHKLILDTDSRQEELYDLESDPGEKANIAAKQPDITARLRGVLNTHIAECAEAAKKYQIEGDAARPKLTRQDVEALRQLGYLQ